MKNFLSFSKMKKLCHLIFDLTESVTARVPRDSLGDSNMAITFASCVFASVTATFISIPITTVADHKLMHTFS